MPPRPTRITPGCNRFTPPAVCETPRKTSPRVFRTQPVKSVAAGNRACRWGGKIIKSDLVSFCRHKQRRWCLTALGNAAADGSDDGWLGRPACMHAWRLRSKRGISAINQTGRLQRHTQDGSPARPEPIQDGAHQDRPKVEREDADRPQHRQLRLLRLAARDAAALLNHHCERTQHKRRSVSQRLSAELTSTANRHSLACPVQRISVHCCECCCRMNG